MGWKLKMQRGFSDFERVFSRISCSFPSSIKPHLFTKEHVVNVNFMDILLGPERSHLSPEVAGVSGLSIMLVYSRRWGQWMSPEFGCFVFLLQKTHYSSSLSVSCILSLSDMHFYHKKDSNQLILFECGNLSALNENKTKQNKNPFVKTKN